MKSFLKIGVLFLLIFFVAPIIASKILRKYISQSLENSGYFYKSDVKTAIRIMAASIPIRIDDNTIIKSLEYDEVSNTVIFEYEITGVSKVDFENILPYIKNEQLHVIKNSPNNTAFVKTKVIFKYIYFDTSGTDLGNFVIFPNEYL
ncbi:hypothetical protein PG291_02250 [Riemerella anatipestifer]|nr:hypothetical protein [Riemerella anatipestifer]